MGGWASGHRSLLIGQAGLPQLGIQGGEVGDRRPRHQEVAPSVANEVLHAPLLPAHRRVREDRCEAVDAAEVRECGLLRASVPFQDLQHGWLEVVIDDGQGYPTPELEGVPLPQQEAVLPRGGEALDEDRTGIAQATGKVRHRRLCPIQDDDCLPEVELGAFSRRDRQRDEGFRHWLAALAHQLAHRRLGDADPVARQFDPHPVRRPALLGRPALEACVFLEPPFDSGEDLLTHRGDARLPPRVAPLPGLRWLAQQRRHRVPRDPKVLGGGALGAPLDQHPVPNIIAQSHAVHPSGSLLPLRAIHRRV